MGRYGEIVVSGTPPLLQRREIESDNKKTSWPARRATDRSGRNSCASGTSAGSFCGRRGWRRVANEAAAQEAATNEASEAPT